MGLDIGGNTIVKSGTGIALNSLVFNSAGQGTTNTAAGYSGWKGGGSTYYSGVSGWEINQTQWNANGLNPALNGIFTCPVAGLYAVGYNGLHRGGSGIPAGFNTYGYSCFAKNGAMNYHTHWNQSTAAGNTYWNTGGASGIFSCQAGDTLALFINRAPSPASPDGISQNYGMYPDSHHCVWCKLVG